MTIAECNSPVAENIARIIAEKGLKQVHVSEKAGYNAQNLSDMIHGRKLIKVSDVIRISKVLSVNIAQLYVTERECNGEEKRSDD